MTRDNYAVCTDGWESIYGLLSQLFSKNERLFKVRPPTGSHVHRKSGSIKEMAQGRQTLLLHTTNRRYHMVYIFVPFPTQPNPTHGELIRVYV